jgi:hypothetical protein
MSVPPLGNLWSRFRSWAAANRARVEILAIAGVAIGFIIIMFLVTLFIIFRTLR